MPKNNISKEIKLQSINDLINGKISFNPAARKLSVHVEAVREWVHKYQKQGIDGLIDHRGKRKTPESITETEKLRAELKIEKAKNKCFELENIVLKNLNEFERRQC